MTAYVRRASVPPHLVDDRDPPAIALLKEDHQILRALFDLVETISGDVLFPIVGEICVRLAIHMSLEEEFLYPALRFVLDPRDIDEAMLDHQRAKLMISRIMDMTGREAFLRIEAQRFGEDVIRHVDDEDRELFRDARRAWDEGRVDFGGIAIQMQNRRRDLFTLIGQASAEARAFDIDLPADAVECVAQSGSPIEGQARPERSDWGGHGRH